MEVFGLVAHIRRLALASVGRIRPSKWDIRWQGQAVARHERSYGLNQYVLDLEHYLDVLARKPGALRSACALAQWRGRGRCSKTRGTHMRIYPYGCFAKLSLPYPYFTRSAILQIPLKASRQPW